MGALITFLTAPAPLLSQLRVRSAMSQEMMSEEHHPTTAENQVMREEDETTAQEPST